jgi:tetratricopeptide (TPR) repeat protein
LLGVLGLKPAPHPDPQTQLLGYLSDKHLLLILDNFEHLSEASETVATLLQHSANLKLLVTSRESLKLSAEWLFDLQGLRHPSELSDPDSLENYDAVQLFIAGVRRVAPQLTLSPQDVQTIAGICQTLQGHPLALELASSWARLMPLERIAKELGQGYNLFETDLADLPERHRNLKAILDTTWAGLSEKKRQTLARLAVFAGGCTLEAAEQVCDSHFSILLALVNESLLKRSSNRLEMHGLVQHYAANKLTDQAELYGQTQERHALYFSSQLGSSSNNFIQMLPDLENCRQGWLWLGQHHRLDPLEAALNGIDYLYTISGRYTEGQQLYGQTVAQLQAHPPSAQRDRLMAGVINGLADQSAAMGKMEQAEHQLEASRALLAPLKGVEKQLGYVFTSMARLDWQKGDYRGAESCLKMASQTIAGIGDLRQETNILHALGLVLREQGKLAEAQECYQQALERYLQMNEVGNAALALNNIGALQLSLHQPEAAQVTLQRGLALVRHTPMERAEAHLTLTYAGALYQARDYPAARTQFGHSLALAEKIQEHSIMGDSLRMLGNTYLKLNQPRQAQIYLLRSLRQSWQLQAWPLLMADLLSLAEWFAGQADIGQSLKLLAQVLHHPASKSDTLEEAQQLLGSLNAPLPEVGELGELVEGLLGSE